MSFIDKIKSFFFDTKEEQVKKEEQVLEVIPTQPVPEPKGEIISNCLMCNNPIGSEDRTRDLNGYIFHKRCSKRVVNEMLKGKKVEDIIKNQKEVS